ncbi:hypothetical protein R1sor_003021 [Riccia sorocarpa]|uniref:Uncharacterized protein n=1 Tax=Riccia sorocarpa TaxID=122646 RepID=A0ABD3H4B5_9MARC
MSLPYDNYMHPPSLPASRVPPLVPFVSFDVCQSFYEKKALPASHGRRREEQLLLLGEADDDQSRTVMEAIHKRQLAFQNRLVVRDIEYVLASRGRNVPVLHCPGNCSSAYV